MVLNYPNPGKYGRVLEALGEPQVKPTGYCSDIPPPSMTPSFESNPQTVQDGGSGPSSASFGVASSTTLASQSPETTKRETRIIAITETAKVRSTVTKTQAGGLPVGTAKAPEGAVPCTTHGAIVCVDDGMFGICNWGSATPQRLAAGTECVGGKVVAKGDGAVRPRRHQHGHAHVRN